MQGPRDDFPNGGGGEQPADSLTDSLNGIEFAQAGPQPQPDRQRPKEKGKSERERLKYRIEDQFEGRLPGVEPNERLERLTMAVRVVTYALEELRKDPAVQAKLAKHAITLKGTAYYLPIMIKESALKSDLVSASNAKGYFQILVNKQTGESQTLTEVEKYSGRKFSTAEIYYSGTDITKQYEAAKKNAMAGILYWHLCRDVYWKKNGLTISDRDRDRVAATCYNLGPTAFLDLWDTLKPQDFTQFARLIGKKLAREFPENIAIPEDRRPDAFNDDTYNIGYWVHAYETGVLSDNQEIKIGKYTYKAKKLLTVLRYAELIDAMMGNAPVTTKKLPEPLKDFVVVGEDEKWMWSIANQLLAKCRDDYKIPYCIDPKTTKSDKIQFLIDVLIAYNREIDNPDFEEVMELESIERGYKVYYPTKEYLEKAVEQSDKDVAPPKKPKPPEVITREGLYTGTKAAEWSQQGAEKFPKTSKPAIVTPDGVKPETKSKHGKMPKSSVTSIVLHTTEGSPNGLYNNLGIHYIVREDGTIELIRDPGIAIDHAGLMGNSRHKGSWNGDGDISLHSIGIEVENKSMNTLMKDGKLLIEADPKKVAKKKVGKKTYFYTDKPPAQKALDSGMKQAKTARAINAKQYAALKSLTHWLGYEFGLQKKDVVTHSMVAVSKYGRGRKPDPPAVDWSKLDLPDNHHLIDQEVLTGTVVENLGNIKSERNGTKLQKVSIKRKEYFKIIPVEVGGVTKYSYVPLPHFGAEDDMTAGVEAAVALRPKKKP